MDLLKEIFSVCRFLNVHTEDGRLVKLLKDMSSVCNFCRLCILIIYYIHIISTYTRGK